MSSKLAEEPSGPGAYGVNDGFGWVVVLVGQLHSFTTCRTGFLCTYESLVYGVILSSYFLVRFYGLF